MKLRTIDTLDVEGKRVLMRVDFNVPLKEDRVTDDTRIRAALPTMVELLKRGARLVLCSHLGRPDGQVVDKLRLEPLVPVLRDALNSALALEHLAPLEVFLSPDVAGEGAQKTITAAGNNIVLLENLRFEPGEEANDPDFCRQLAALADCYVSDAFGTVHRAHASTEGVAHLLPSAAGRLVEAEVSALSKVIDDPVRPLVIVMGGAKISGKLEVLESLIPLADSVCIGGAMANTFLAAQGHNTGNSLVEQSMFPEALRMLELAKEKDTALILPLDYRVGERFDNPESCELRPADGMQDGDVALDIGDATLEKYHEVIWEAQTVFWNGPMGVFEQERFATGTLGIARTLAAVSDRGAVTIVGGGESVAAVNRANVAGHLTHVSTGGGASLEFVAGDELPGLRVLLAD
ncbi:phosphoglycerate kinase [bacterium]|nr:phosphoglycerate kinase [bacterium]